jgi:hypothetical protein
MGLRRATNLELTCQNKRKVISCREGGKITSKLLNVLHSVHDVRQTEMNTREPNFLRLKLLLQSSKWCILPGIDEIRQNFFQTREI